MLGLDSLGIVAKEKAHKASIKKISNIVTLRLRTQNQKNHEERSLHIDEILCVIVMM